MNKLLAKHGSYRRGAASIYVVIFATILLTLIVMSFVRIMLSEARQTINFDLSQSAYDSARIGVEDAKIALLAYHECLSTGDAGPTCTRIVESMQNPDHCDIVRDVLNREEGDQEETIIQTTTDGVGAEFEQAYTCVRISEVAPDYLGRLNAGNTSRLIPVRTAVDNIGNVQFVHLRWFTPANGSATPASQATANQNKLGFANNSAARMLPPAITATPPPIVFQFIQTAETFNLSQFDVNVGATANRGTLMLVPSQNGLPCHDFSTDCAISNSQITGLAASSDKAIHNPIAVHCSEADALGSPRGFFCSAVIELPAPIGGNRLIGSSFIRLLLPYGGPDTDFSIQLFSNDVIPVPISFEGVQAVIDSTGRSNDLFRRVEARVELVDNYFPIPEFAVSLNGDPDDYFHKSFFVTNNCWSTAHVSATNPRGYCNNSGAL